MRPATPTGLSNIAMILAGILLAHSVLGAQELVPGQVVELPFADAELPATLHSMWTSEKSLPRMAVRLPDDYSRENKFPLLVYVPGFHGGPTGNIGNARTIAGDHGWVVASLPLFKKSIDRAEIAGGIAVSINDHPVISKAYAKMLGRLFELVPNLDREKSAMVGFSNGAITIGVLISSHDEFILEHFRNFCLVDQGMFHLCDIHKKGTRDSRFLLLVGDDTQGFDRELMIRQSQLLQDVAKVHGVDLTHQLLKDTGHEFADRHMRLVGEWIRHEPNSTR